MRGQEVFYPIGWDDNGLATERRVQNYYGITCDPALPYQADFVPPGPDRPKQAAPVPVSRRNFIELCRRRTEIDESACGDLLRREISRHKGRYARRRGVIGRL
jgi:valyl-tRNA synthetase